MAKQQPPQLQNTSQTDTTIPIKGMTKDPNSSLVSKENWTHAINAINNSDDGDVGTLGNEQANKLCGNAPFTIIGAIHLYGDKWILFSTNNEQSEIGKWDDSECKYERVINDYVCYNPCESEVQQFAGAPIVTTTSASTPCLNFKTQHLISGASKENFDCSWQVYWDDGFNPSRTLNLNYIPYIQEQVTGPPVDQDDCITFHDTECIDCEKLRLAPLLDIPCIELSKSPDGGQLRNGSYQAFIAYTVNDQVIGDYYGISNIQPLFAHEDLLSGLEIKLSNLDTQFEYFQLVVVSNNQNEMQAKEIGFYSTHQSNISIDYINQSLKSIPLTAIPLSTPAFEKSDHMYVVNDYLIRQGPTQQYDFNYQPLANEIHTHWTSTEFPSDYYKKGGNKPTFMRDEVYAFFIRFIYNTGEKSSSYHIPGPDTAINFNNAFNPVNPLQFTLDDGIVLPEDSPMPGSNDLSTVNWINDGSSGTAPPGDMVFEVFNTMPNGGSNTWTLNQTSTDYFETDDGGVSIAEGHMGYWQSTERYPNDPVRWNGVSGLATHNLCGKHIRHHKFPDETCSVGGPGGPLDRSDITGQHINVLGVNFWHIKWPRFSIDSGNNIVDPNQGLPLGPLIPNIVGYEILVGSREGNKSIIGKGIARNMRQYTIPASATGKIEDAGVVTGYIPNYPFNSAQADPYLSSAAGFTYGNAGTVTPGSNNWNPYPGINTSDHIFTIHSPELSFNRPFLSPWEIRTYGMCTGTSIGRFIPSEKHPGEKLLRNISMWVAIIVGIGYAIQEMRGRKKKKIMPPKALSIGLDTRGEEVDGGDGSLSPSVAVATGVPPAATVTTGTLTLNAISGGDFVGAAPSNSINPSGSLLLNNNASMMSAYTADATSILPIGEPARDTTLTTGTMLGGPKLAMLAYEAGTTTAYSTMTNNPLTNRGYIGAGEEIEYQGSRFESAPSATQVLFGLYNFMNFTAEGGQHIIDLIYNLVSYQDYVYKYGGHGLYLNTTPPASTAIRRMLVEKARYIGSTIQNLSANIRINNLQRPSTVAVLASFVNNGFRLPNLPEDNSRFIIGNFNGHYNPSQWRVAPVGANYISLKVAFKNQYGQIDQIKQLPTGCYFNFKDTFQDSEDTIETVDTNTEFYTPTIFGGDTYINRYTEKVIMPFFWDFLSGQPDGFPYDYRLRSNVPRPIYWMNTAKYDLSELVRHITSFAWLTGGGTPGATATGVLPNQMFFLDRPNADMVSDAFGGTTGGVGGPGAGGTPTGASGGAQDSVTTGGSGGRSLFHIKNGYMYSHCNGVQDFFVESTLNMGLRDHEDTNAKRHFDFVEYTNTEAMFHSDIVREDNFYKYDASLSRTRFNTQLISWGFIQPRDYDPTVAANCYAYYPKRLIYSLQAQKEAKKDFWRVFLPMNYKDFKNRVNVIKPVTKSGALVLFPNLAPALFQGVDQLQTDLGTKLTIGDGGLFSQPMQNIVNADLAHEYGSCESARSVVNTPSGVFYISQAQGKVFNYDGSSIQNIANAGMKQWFNKYLPSVLLNQYPELEDCNGWIDNPVAGVGCQTVYDPNYDIVYFCKKDYEALVPECIDFIPCEGFYYNETRCGETEQTFSCPDGYTYNPDNPIGQECEKITDSEANIGNSKSIKVDIVLAISSADLTVENYGNRSNVGNMQQAANAIISGLTAELDRDDVRIGLCHFGSGRNTRDPLFSGQVNIPNNTVPDEMFEPITGTYTTGSNGYGNQITLTNNQDVLEDWLGQSSGQINNNLNYSYFGDYLPNVNSTYGIAASQIDKPLGCDIAGGMWTAQNLLYGKGSREVRKILIVLDDTFAYNVGIDAGKYTSSTYTQTITGSDVFADDGVTSMTVSSPTPNMDIGEKIFVSDDGNSGPWDQNWYLNDNHATWVNENILNNSQYQTLTYGQITMNIMFNTAQPEGVPIDTEAYFQQFADPNQLYVIDNVGNAYTGIDNGLATFDTTIIPNSIEEHTNSILNQILSMVGSNSTGEQEPCDPECELMYNNADQPFCRCTEYLQGTISDSTSLLSLDDENYFKDVSWTVSYDPKAKAWISFHDWHPDLTIPSLNHFFTTKNFIDLTNPECPPGFEWDPTGGVEGIGACCKNEQVEYLADVIIEETIPTIQNAPSAYPTDIVFSIDTSGSTKYPLSSPDTNIAPPYSQTVRGDFQRFLDAFITVFADDMYGTDGTDGNVQVGINCWGSPGLNSLIFAPDGGAPWQTISMKAPDLSGNAGSLNGISMSNYVGNQLTAPINDQSGTYSDINWGKFVNGSDGMTAFGLAFELGQMQLSKVDSSLLGDRTANPNYKRIHIFMSDGEPTLGSSENQCVPSTINENNNGTLNFCSRVCGNGFLEEGEVGMNNASDCGECNEASWQSFNPAVDNAGIMNATFFPFCGQGERFQGDMDSNLPSNSWGFLQNNAENAGITSLNSNTYGLFRPTILATGAALSRIGNAFYRILANIPSGISGWDPQYNFAANDIYGYDNVLVTNQIEEKAQLIANDVLCFLPSCICPDGYTRVTTPQSMLPNSYVPTAIGSESIDCDSPEGSQNNGLCRKISCDCNVENITDSIVEGSYFETGRCDDTISNAVADYYAQSIVFPDINLGDPNYFNTDPLMCNYDTLCCIGPSYDKGGIWKHNDRCDLFTNYYDKDYPWEVEIVESSGQTVNTVRSVEYQLESYIYNGNLNNDCGDKFHDLDFNFDEVIIHNTEQVSGLLRLNLSPKNDAPLITDFPIISGNDIQILYSKEEQKYRFNQFWDITKDRGEFTQSSQSIFITELNGYIRELNQANLNYFKPAFQHKKFRHYWNKVIFRRISSRNRKMILKLTNTKINASFR